MYIVIPTTTLKRTIQRDTVKNKIGKLQRNAKKCSNDSKEGRKGKMEELKTEATKIKWLL